MANAAAQVGFRPVHEAHAIEHLLATIHFDRPIDDHGIRTAIELMAQFQVELPGRNEIRGMGFQIGPQGVMPLTQGGPSEVPDGLVRFLMDGRGVMVKELRVDRQSIVFRTQAYTRWDAVWSEARGYIQALLPRLGVANLSAYSLAYVNKFIWTGSPESAQSESLFRPDSPYVTSKSLEAKDLWHCHTGRFESNSTQVKRLEAVNLDCADEQDEAGQPQRVVRISTTITDIFNQPGFTPHQVNGEEALPMLDRAFPELHIVLKDVFSKIVSDSVAAQIGLDVNAS